jgi:hypothetical protein
MLRETAPSLCPDDVRAVQAARQELEAARQWFDWVSEPRLVDEAVFRLRAAEMRLAHALRPLKEAARGVGLG